VKGNDDPTGHGSKAIRKERQRRPGILKERDFRGREEGRDPKQNRTGLHCPRRGWGLRVYSKEANFAQTRVESPPSRPMRRGCSPKRNPHHQSEPREGRRRPLLYPGVSLHGGTPLEGAEVRKTALDVLKVTLTLRPATWGMR